MKILIGSTFPLSLIRRDVRIHVSDICEIRNAGVQSEIYSFWGHSNTIPVANKLLGFDISPKTQRPALFLSQDFFPMLDGNVFKECWILSPDYVPGFRPEIGAEVSEDKIKGWQVLKIIWG